MTIKKNIVMKDYKKLSIKKEAELVLWLELLKDSIDNALLQISRWKSYRNNFDLNILIIIISNIDDTRKNLKQFLSCDKEVWNIFKVFEKKFKNLKLREMRDDIIHPEKLFQFKNRKGQDLNNQFLMIIGGYNQTLNEYTFGSNKVIISDLINFLNSFSKGLECLFEKRLKIFYKTGKYKGIIPWGQLSIFSKK